MTTAAFPGMVGDVDVTIFGVESFEEFRSDPWFVTKFVDDVVLPIVVVVKLALGVRLDNVVLVVCPSGLELISSSLVGLL